MSGVRNCMYLVTGSREGLANSSLEFHFSVLRRKVIYADIIQEKNAPQQTENTGNIIFIYLSGCAGGVTDSVLECEIGEPVSNSYRVRYIRLRADTLRKIRKTSLQPPSCGLNSKLIFIKVVIPKISLMQYSNAKNRK